MNLSFETWIKEQKVEESSLFLFEESFKAYRASAYSASLLFSYLGFQDILRFRILNAKNPVNIDEKAWSEQRENIINNDIWDATVFQMTQRTGDKKIFLISDSLKKEVEYWKNKRNECAHFKNENITYIHVESFWLFLTENLKKFTIEKAEDLIINGIINHFNILFKAPGAELGDVVKLFTTYEVKDWQDLLSKIQVELNEKKLGDKFSLIIRSLLMGIKKDKDLKEIKDFINTRHELLISVLRIDISFVVILNIKNETARHLIYKEMFSLWDDIDFNIYVSFFRNGIIKKEELHEFNSFIFKKSADFSIPEEVIPDLIEMKYFKLIYGELIPKYKTTWSYGFMNDHRDSIILYFKHLEVNDDFLEMIYCQLTAPHLPKYFLEDLKYFLNNNVEKKLLFKEFIDKKDSTERVFDFLK